MNAAVASMLELETYLDVRRREDEVVIASAGRMGPYNIIAATYQ